MGFYGKTKDLLGAKKGVLLDIDGVLLNNGKSIPGGREFISFLRDIKKPFLLITNTTIKSRDEIFKKLLENGFQVEKKDILTSINVANNYMYKKFNKSPISAYLLPPLFEDLPELNLSDKNPRAILLGDIGDSFNRSILNKIFNQLVGGAKFYALHKNRFWKAGEKLFMDLGGFVSALEYSSGISAEIIGKPSKIMFNEALKILNLEGKEVLIIGDDYESDILGAKKAGIDGILVLTGKYSEKILEKRNFHPDYLIKNLYELLN